MIARTQSEAASSPPAVKRPPMPRHVRPCDRRLHASVAVDATDRPRSYLGGACVDVERGLESVMPWSEHSPEAEASPDASFVPERAAPIRTSYVSIENCRALKAAWDLAEYCPPYNAGGFRATEDLSPTVEEWLDLLNECLAASVRTDEARSTRFRIAIERDVADRSGGTRGWGTEHRLSKPVPFDADELVRLAHASTDPKSCIWIRRRRSDLMYVMSGIGSDFVGWKIEDDPDQEQQGPPTCVPIVEVFGLARLRVLKGRTLVAHEQIEFVRPGPAVKLIEARLRGLEEQLVSILEQNTPSLKAPSERRDAVLAYARQRVVFALARLVARILHHAHGGLVVLLPHVERLSADTRRTVDIKYECSVPFFASIGVARGGSFRRSRCDSWSRNGLEFDGVGGARGGAVVLRHAGDHARAAVLSSAPAESAGRRPSSHFRRTTRTPNRDRCNEVRRRRRFHRWRCNSRRKRCDYSAAGETFTKDVVIFTAIAAPTTKSVKVTSIAVLFSTISVKVSSMPVQIR
jgi:hypothetical protein